MATWNIVDGRRGRLAQAAAGLAQMRVGLAVLTETKLVDDRHPKTASGYTIMCSKAVSGHQGGVALVWKENDPKFEVESVLFNNGPNIVTFQLTTGDERFYVIGIYVPPDCSNGVDDLRRAWDACPQGCKPIILGDFNINFGYPRDEREDIIVRCAGSDSECQNELVQELVGRGAKSAEGRGITRSQITSWLVQGICPNLREWDSDPRGFSIRIIAQSSRTFGWTGKDG